MTEPLKRSVHITNYYHKSSGGISTSYNNLMNAAAAAKREVRLIVPGEAEAVEDYNDYAKIYYIPAKYSPVFDKRYRIIMPWQYMPSESHIRKVMLDEMPQMVEVTDKYTLSMIGAMIRKGKFSQLGRPMLVHFSCERMDDNISSFLVGGKLGQWTARRVMGNYNFPSFDFHIANSAYTADEFERSVLKRHNPKRSMWFINKCWQWLGSPRIPVTERIHVCPRGVDAERFSPEKRSAEGKAQLFAAADIPDTAVAILYAGRISPEKNIPLLVEMMKVLRQDKSRDIRLVVAGAGPLSEWLDEQAKRLGDNVIVQLGHLDKDELARHYANADVFVHPNPREPFGIAPLEAMASGVATVAPNGGGILSYATSDNIWLVEPTGMAFAAAVAEVISDPDLRERKIANALETARSNTRELSTANLLATYDKLYKDFQERNELFTDSKAASNFDFTSLIDA